MSLIYRPAFDTYIHSCYNFGNIMSFENIHERDPGAEHEDADRNDDDTVQQPSSPRRRRRPPILDEDGFPDPELRGCDYVRPARGFDGRPVDLG